MDEEGSVHIYQFLNICLIAKDNIWGQFDLIFQQFTTASLVISSCPGKFNRFLIVPLTVQHLLVTYSSCLETLPEQMYFPVNRDGEGNARIFSPCGKEQPVYEHILDFPQKFGFLVLVCNMDSFYLK